MSKRIAFLEKPSTFITNGNGHKNRECTDDPVILRTLIKIKQQYIEDRDLILDELFAAIGEIARNLDDSPNGRGFVWELVKRQTEQSETQVSQKDYMDWRNQLTFEQYVQLRRTLTISAQGAIDMLHEIQDLINVELGKASAERALLTRGETSGRTPPHLD